jgi:RNA polymerase sigma-70 factor (ECF subfamily)
VDAGGPADEIARTELTAAFRRAMLELPLQHREVIALCDLEELPYATVAGILDCPVGTVRSRLHRARALLTIRLASLELIDLQGEPSAQRGLT